MSLQRLVRIALPAVAFLAVAGCGRSPAQETPPPPEVGVVVVQPQAHEQTIRLAGRVAAFQMSEVRPQVGGIVRRRLFQEGARVSAGQALYEIDPGPSQADLASAEAAASAARARYERLRSVVDVGAVSRQAVEDARAAADQAYAARAAARITVGYTRVRAPISGVIGVSSVTSGALATPSQPTPFAVIQQIDRVYVDMTQSSLDGVRLRQYLARPGVRPRVRLTLQDGSEYPLDGTLQLAEVTVDPNTGAVRLRALFSNPRQVLLPGMFVQATVSVGVDPDAILAPQRGVTRNARGEAVVLLVNQQNVVEERIIETGPTAGDQWVVLSGLAGGERVIVEGSQRVQPGATVTAVAPTAQQPTAAPANAPQPEQGGEAEKLRGRGD
jgi:membrane fusion protein (multidrug efflux system)